MPRDSLASDRDLVVATRAHLTLPHHRELDRLREEGPGKIGTTKKGIGPTYESKAARIGLRFGDLFRPDRFRALLARQIEVFSPILVALGGTPPDAREIAASYLALADELRPYAADASRFVNDSISRGENVLFEGAQGVLLDVDHGTYPYVTSSSTTAGGACAALGVGPTKIDTVLGIAKGYATRVGAGPFPTELEDDIGNFLRNRGNEFGSVTGRPRRCGWLDVPALRLAIRISGIEGLALTKLDVMATLPKVKMCVAYRLRGQTLEEMPLDLEDLAAAEPVFEEMDGWSDMASDTIPPAAARFVERISALVGIPVWGTSWGPGRSQTILTRALFL